MNVRAACPSEYPQLHDAVTILLPRRVRSRQGWVEAGIITLGRIPA